MPIMIMSAPFSRANGLRQTTVYSGLRSRRCYAIISIIVGPVKHFLSRALPSLKRVFPSACWVVFPVGVDDCDSFVSEQSASVRPPHLFAHKLQTRIRYSNSLS